MQEKTGKRGININVYFVKETKGQKQGKKNMNALLPNYNHYLNVTLLLYVLK